MDSTLNVEDRSRLSTVRDVRGWREGHSLPARLATLVVPIVAVLAGCFLVMNTVQARVQIDFDPMRPPASANPAANPAAAAAGGASTAEAAAAPALPTLKITRQTGAGGGLSALVDDTWVRRGDVVAGYRVTALRNESIDLVNLNDPTQRLTLRLNPVTVDRNDATARTAVAPSSWPALALEKK